MLPPKSEHQETPDFGHSPPNIELSAEYYIHHLAKTQKSLANKWSPLGRHHNNLNKVLQDGISLVPENERVLDAGCGLSIWIRPEFRRRYRITGVDVQPQSIAACTRIYQGCDYRLADLYALDFENDSFGGIAMREVIEHFREPERAVREVHRVLKPGGIYVLTTPNYDSWLLHFIEHTYNRFFGGPCKPYLDDVHPSKFRYATLRALIGKYFRIEKYFALDYGVSLGCVAKKP